MTPRDMSPISETRMLFRNQVMSPIGGIDDCGFIKNGRGVPGSSRIFGSYAIVLLAYGQGTYRDPSGEVEVGPGDVITVLPDVPHWYGPKPGCAFDTLHVVFRGAVFDSWRAAGMIGQGSLVAHVSPVEHWLDRMGRALGSGNHGSPQLAVREVLAIQEFLYEIHCAGTASTELSWADRARSLMTSLPDAHAAADAAGMSYERFRKKFTEAVGLSPQRFKSGVLMDQACQILASEDLTLREVADRLGFADEFHFSRRFKEAVGVPPSVFRSRYR